MGENQSNSNSLHVCLVLSCVALQHLLENIEVLLYIQVYSNGVTKIFCIPICAFQNFGRRSKNFEKQLEDWRMTTMSSKLTILCSQSKFETCKKAQIRVCLNLYIVYNLLRASVTLCNCLYHTKLCHCATFPCRACFHFLCYKSESLNFCNLHLDPRNIVKSFVSCTRKHLFTTTTSTHFSSISP